MRGNINGGTFDMRKATFSSIVSYINGICESHSHNLFQLSLIKLLIAVSQNRMEDILKQENRCFLCSFNILHAASTTLLSNVFRRCVVPSFCLFAIVYINT